MSVLRELQGVMPGFGATHGLIVSWGGFKDSVIREARRLYFQIRLWDAGDPVDALQETYEKFPAKSSRRKVPGEKLPAKSSRPNSRPNCR
ncbi:MAG: restriction endonuclease [Alphaproteobacteria bacterium]